MNDEARQESAVDAVREQCQCIMDFEIDPQLVRCVARGSLVMGFHDTPHLEPYLVGRWAALSIALTQLSLRR